MPTAAVLIFLLERFCASSRGERPRVLLFLFVASDPTGSLIFNQGTPWFHLHSFVALSYWECGSNLDFHVSKAVPKLEQFWRLSILFTFFSLNRKS